MNSPEELRKYFYLAQIGLGALFIFGMFWLRGRGESSLFNRTSDPDHKRKHLRGKPDLLGEAKLKPDAKKSGPLKLTGISIHGAPHEILGIPAKSDSAVIQKAYRELMKLYHPDLVGRPGSREWTDAQKIAEALNRAKETLLKSRK